jgi:transposase
MEYRLYIGVDVSKESFTVCIKNPNGKTVFQGSFPQSLEGFQDFLNTVNNLSPDPVIVGMESTSIYYLNLFSFLLENGINTVIINPSVIKNFSKLGIRDAKSDRKDASTIAEYLLYAKPELSDKEKLSDLKLLSREKEKLSKEISHLKDEILRCLFNLFPELERNFNVFSKGMLNFLLKFPSARKIRRSKRKTVEYEFNKAFEGRGKKPSFTANDIIELANRSIGIDSVALEEILVTKINMLLTIEEEIDKFDKLISERIEEIQIDKIDIITSIPGIGKSLATSFICEVPEAEMFKDGKSLVAFVGVDPVVRQSGQYIGKHGISKKGNRHLRRIIYLMAINVIRFEGRFKEFYLRLRARGKSYMEAVIAVANKLLRTIYAMLIHRTYYSPNYS